MCSDNTCVIDIIFQVDLGKVRMVETYPLAAKQRIATASGAENAGRRGEGGKVWGMRASNSRSIRGAHGKIGPAHVTGAVGTPPDQTCAATTRLQSETSRLKTSRRPKSIEQQTASHSGRLLRKAHSHHSPLHPHIHPTGHGILGLAGEHLQVHIRRSESVSLDFC